ncbi:MAG: HDOD domain-containing protein [Verrucomicrobiota bacterium]
MPSPRFQAPLEPDQIIQLGCALVPAAATLGRLRLLLTEPSTDLDEIVNLIRLDPALTFHVVRLSNSVLFGTRERQDTLEGAVGRMGLIEIYQLVGLAATKQLCQRDLPTYRLKAARLWENSVATAAAAEVLARPAGGDAGLSYATGLLRNLGAVIIDGCSAGTVYPGEAEWPLVSEWEREVFGLTAAEVTATLLDHWRFPAELVDAVRAHHEPFAEPASNVGACVLNLACGVAARFGLDLPGETGHWARSEAKLTLAGVTDEVLEQCAEHARAHYLALCASLHS